MVVAFAQKAELLLSDSEMLLHSCTEVCRCISSSQGGKLAAAMPRTRTAARSLPHETRSVLGREAPAGGCLLWKSQHVLLGSWCSRVFPFRGGPFCRGRAEAWMGFGLLATGRTPRCWSEQRRIREGKGTRKRAVESS